MIRDQIKKYSIIKRTIFKDRDIIECKMQTSIYESDWFIAKLEAKDKVRSILEKSLVNGLVEAGLMLCKPDPNRFLRHARAVKMVQKSSEFYMQD